MSLPAMWAAVLQTAVLDALRLAFEHESGRWEYGGIWEDEAVLNFARALNASSATGTTTTSVSNSNSNTNTTPALIDGASAANLTALSGAANATSAAAAGPAGEGGELFYLAGLPRAVFLSVATGVLYFWWQVWLERLLPARPRNVEVARAGKEKEKEKMIEGSEDREEEVVKRWIARGRVRRSSLSWGNTFLKWIADVTIGSAWVNALEETLEALVKQKSFAVIRGYWTFSNLFYHMVFGLVSPWSLVVLLAFAVVPVEKRLPFRSAMALLTAVFLDALLRVTVPWAVRTEWAQTVLRGATRNMEKMHEFHQFQKGGEHVIDEL